MPARVINPAGGGPLVGSYLYHGSLTVRQLQKLEGFVDVAKTEYVVVFTPIQNTVLVSLTYVCMQTAGSVLPTPKTKLPSVMVVVATRRFVPVAFVKVRFPMVEEGARSSEDEARPPER